MLVLTNRVHVCLELPNAPKQGVEYEPDARWVCDCGDNFVYHEGFNRAGYKEWNWYQAAPIAIPEQRKAQRSLRDRLIRPRKGK